MPVRKEGEMSATEVLRRMLDERGVEWWQSANTLGCIFTRWHSPIFGDEVVAMENGEEGLVLFDHFVTPEQAIEATLGRGTCIYEIAAFGDGKAWFQCSECGGMASAEYDPPKYCPHCGCKVVDE
jgi:hypothetical protein